MAWMHVSHNPRDGELAPYRPETTLVVGGVAMGVNPNPPDGPLGGAGDQCVRKDDCFRVPCDNPGNRLFYDGGWPRLEVREVVTACPSPTPPPPGPTPTPGPPGPTATPPPGGGPPLFQMGGSMLAPRDCGQKCREQGYLGYVLNWTCTPLCDGRRDDCVCFNEAGARRDRCEIPKQFQDPAGATIWITLPGVFGPDLMDERSDNKFNGHHKPKANETGVTEVRCVPPGTSSADPRGVSRFVDIRPDRPVLIERGPAPVLGLMASPSPSSTSPTSTSPWWPAAGLAALVAGGAAVWSMRRRSR